MVEAHVFPQTGDNDSAENFAQLLGHPLTKDVVAVGMKLNPDFTVPELTISGGLCFVNYDEAVVDSVGDDDGETRLNPGYAVTVPQNTLSLSANSQSYIYVDPKVDTTHGSTTDDNPSYEVVDNTGDADDDWLRIGQVDGQSESFVEENRLPDLEVNNLSIEKLGEISIGPNDNYVVSYNDNIDSLSIDGDKDILDIADNSIIVGDVDIISSQSSLSFNDTIDFNDSNLLNAIFETPVSIENSDTTLFEVTGSGPATFVNADIEMDGTTINNGTGEVMLDPSGGNNTIYANSSNQVQVYDASSSSTAGGYGATDKWFFNENVKIDSSSTLSVENIEASSSDVTISGTSGDIVDFQSGDIIAHKNLDVQSGATIRDGNGDIMLQPIGNNNSIYANSNKEIRFFNSSTSTVVGRYADSSKWSFYENVTVNSVATLFVEHIEADNTDINVQSDLEFQSSVSINNENGETMFDPVGGNNTIYANSNNQIRFYDDSDNSIAGGYGTTDKWFFNDNVKIASTATLIVDNIEKAVNDVTITGSSGDIITFQSDNIIFEKSLDVQSGVLNLSDTSTSPSSTGEFRVDGSDVKVYTGGSVVNLSVADSSFTDADAIDAINDDADHGSTASHNYYTDGDAISAINNDSDHGSTASHNYFSGSHNNLSDVGSSDHHSRYADEEAQDAVGTIMSGGTDITISYDDAGNTITVDHGDSSSQSNVSTGGATVITDIGLDGRGHVTNINTANRSLSDWSVPSDFDISSANTMGIPSRSSDPAADPGDMWYRTDLD